MSPNQFFNVSDPLTCCYDAKELISKCKKATSWQRTVKENLHNILTILIIS